ncbi:hypothetical protein Trydic_g2663 [Trypoxylus dichotomus]
MRSLLFSQFLIFISLICAICCATSTIKLLAMVLVQKTQYNVLLLGQTDLDEALNAPQARYIIPTVFEWSDNDHNLQTISIGLHEDENEHQIFGESATQYVKSYLFEFENVAIRIIDTPGFGDTSGGIKDEQICENLFRFLLNRQELEKLHGTQYKPGPTLGLLKRVIENLPNAVGLKCSKQNIFCIENDCIKFLLASFYGNNTSIINDAAKEDYELPWKHSSQEYIRLFQYIKSLKPHSVEDTVSLNIIRYNTIKLRTLLGKIVDEIKKNIDRCKDYETQILRNLNDIAILKDVLYETTIKKENNCNVVCHNNRCKLRNEATSKVVCCANCKAWSLRWCQQMSMFRTTCFECGCNELDHAMHVGTEEIVKKKDERIEGSIQDKEKIVNDARLKHFEQKVNGKKYEAERKFIENYAVKLSDYLERTSISSDQRMHGNVESTPSNLDTEGNENEELAHSKFMEPLNPKNFEMMGEYMEELFMEENIEIPAEKVLFIKSNLEWGDIVEESGQAC